MGSGLEANPTGGFGGFAGAPHIFPFSFKKGFNFQKGFLKFFLKKSEKGPGPPCPGGVPRFKKTPSGARDLRRVNQGGKTAGPPPRAPPGFSFKWDPPGLARPPRGRARALGVRQKRGSRPGHPPLYKIKNLK